MFKQLVVSATIVALGVGAGEAYAHGKDGGRRAAGRRVARNLNINESQKARLRELRQREREATRGMRENVHERIREFRKLRRAGDQRAEQMKQELGSLRTELRLRRAPFREEFRRILTPEQRQKLDALKSQREANQR